MKMRTWSRLALAAVVALAPALASAQAWPSKPVKVIVPFAAGGTTDVVARQLSAKLQDAWGQTVIVENKAGAGGNIGADAVAKSPPDGYTLLMTSGSIVAANPYMYKNMGFDPAKDLAPITNVASGPQVIVVANGLAARDLREFIAYAKANPKKVNFGSAGIGTQTHLAGENLAFQAGLDLEPFAMGDTHKFESRYEHTLVGPYPEAIDLYRARSPIHFVDMISCPMILLQGDEDEVVPPSQSEVMVEALAAKGIPHAYLLFEGEQHGFRKAETIRRAYEAELSFYAQILGFELGDPIEPVTITGA